MRSLFVKILAWFWLATALVIMVVFLTNRLTSSRDEARPHMPPDQMMAAEQVAIDMLERDSAAAAGDYLEELNKNSHAVIFIFDRNGNEVTGRQPVPQALETAKRFINEPGSRPPRRGGGDWMVRPAYGRGGNSYVVVAQGHHPVGPPPFPFLPRVWWAQLLTYILTAGILCYLLARYLSSPLVKLREATRRLAAGDLTARVGLRTRRRDELVDLGRDFDVMAERIESLMTSQQRLLHDISHELRSPLTRLNIALELARHGDPTEASWAMERIERESQRLNTLINQLLTLARMESAPTAQALVRLHELVEEVAMDADFEAKPHNKAVRVVRNDSGFLQGDEQLLRSAIENVLRNAVLYTPEATEVEISLQRRDADSALICVRDHGQGVPPAALENIFRPFYRVGDARDRETGGVGLGLSISQRAVEVHGGTIRAANATGGGLVVEITLPGVVETSDAPRHESPARLPAPQSSPV
ncbi:MAG TPA: ATP-binding protein [Blastocatellia bacterium]|nr:ATP-binding protein [Blastocatellia bacterium]